MLLDGESEEELRTLRQGMRQSLRPVGELEEELVERMVTATWRKRRADRVELGLWDWRETVSSGKSTLANVFFMDSQHDQSLQKLTRYMTAYSGEFRRAFQMLREAQAARRDEADAGDWADVEADQVDVEEDDDDEGEGGNADDSTRNVPTEGSAGAPEPESVAGAHAADFSLGPDSMTRSACSTERSDVDPRAPRGEAKRDASNPKRWQDLSEEERALFAVRNRNEVLAADQIIDEVLFNRQWVERMTVSELLRTSKGLNDMIWQTTLGLDKVIEQEERRQRTGH